MTDFDLKQNLERIRELTETVTPLHMIADITGNKAVYSVETGECGGLGLYKTKSVAVQIAYMGGKTELKCHDHDESEILIPFEGDLEVEFKNGSIQGYIGDPIIISPNEPHVAKSNNGCKMIAITIPSSNGYPDGK